MATVTKLPLSSSVNGRGILITATTSASATNIHTCAPSGSTITDEAWIYVYNEATSSLTASILFGGTTEPGDVVRSIVNPKSRVLLIDGRIIQNGLTIQAYAAVASLITVDGFINRIS